ncbi:hypothetical protein AB4Y89_11205 [Terriglobus sp. 2YAB30_2]|uniref:hypothetical protein n=1 Tax=unclassified Terriglobus TaxID=2628988 RepID=UPI003F9A0BEE
MVDHWDATWRYTTPRQRVVDQLATALKTVQAAHDRSPDDLELTLLLGVVAHYGYNVDLPQTYELAMSMFGKANTLAPEDIRGRWFEAAHVCQSARPAAGMKAFLEIEQSHPWKSLPVDFWDDYMACGTVTVMPAHVLRAADYLSKLNAPANDMRSFLIEANSKRFTDPDPKNVPQQQAWRVRKANSPKVRIGSYLCGFSMDVPGDWEIGFAPVNEQICMVQMQLPQEKKARLHSQVAVMARPAKSEETVKEFLRTAVQHGEIQDLAELPCPVASCVQVKLADKNKAGKDGDEIGWLIAFEKEGPEYPGLLLEEPTDPPTKKEDKPQYFHPAERSTRAKGRILYLFVLDTSSVSAPMAKPRMEELLRSLQVE